MRKTILSFATFILSSSAFAALPSYWDAVQQIQTVINAQEVYREVQGQPIVGIKKISNLTYIISTSGYSARVILEAHVPVHPGPITYSLKSIDKVVYKYNVFN